MDNNGNSLATDLASVMIGTKNFIDRVRTGEGLNIPDNMKEEYHKKLKEQGVDKMLTDLDAKLAEFSTTLKNVNNGSTTQAK